MNGDFESRIGSDRSHGSKEWSYVRRIRQVSRQQYRQRTKRVYNTVAKLTITERQHSLLSEPCIIYGRVVRLSACLSVTRWHCVKTTTQAKSSLTDSPRTLVLAVKIHPQIRKGTPRARALSESGVGKLHNFKPISGCIKKRCKIGPKLL